MWIQYNRQEIKRPSKIKPEITGQRDRKKYCNFHNDHGHTIDEYRKLKDEMKDLLKNGA